MSDAGDNDKSVSELEADIARTRAQLGRDVDDISYKLSPDRFKNQAQETLQDAQEAVMDTVNEMTDTMMEKTKEAGSSFVDMVRRHPLPTALIGAGVALLAAGGGLGAKSARDDDYVGYGSRYGEGEAGGYVQPGYGTEPSASTGHTNPNYQSYGTTRSFESYGAYDSGYDTGSYNPEGASYPAGSAYNTGYSSAGGSQDDRSLGDRAGEAGGRAKYQVREAGRGVGGFIEEQPLIAGLITVVLGALIGLGLPGTRQEDKLMGGARDQLAEQAKEVAGRAKEVAQKTFDEAKETAKQEFGKVQEDVKAEGKNLLEKGKEAAKSVVQETKEAGKTVVQDTKETAKNEADKQKPS